MNKILVLIGLGCMAFSGCATCKDCQYELVQSCHAHWGWHQVGSKCNCSAYPKHFKDGWKAGYKDVALGGCGLLPPVPPQKYWKARYEGCEGQKMIEAWYQGFGLGAVAAEKRCEKTWHPVPTSGLVALPPTGCSDCGCTTTCRQPACCGPHAPVSPSVAPPMAPEPNYMVEPSVEAAPPTMQPSAPESAAPPMEEPQGGREQLPPAEPAAAPIPEPEVNTSSSRPADKPTEEKPLVAQKAQPQPVQEVAQPAEEMAAPKPSASSRITMVEIEQLFSKRIAKQIRQDGLQRESKRYAGYRPMQEAKRQPVEEKAQVVAKPLKSAQPELPKVKVPTLAKVKTKATTLAKVKPLVVPKVLTQQSEQTRKSKRDLGNAIDLKVALEPAPKRQPTVVANRVKPKPLAAKPRKSSLVKVAPVVTKPIQAASPTVQPKVKASQQIAKRPAVASQRRMLPKVVQAPQAPLLPPVVAPVPELAKPTTQPRTTKPRTKLTLEIPQREQQPQKLKSSVKIVSAPSTQDTAEQSAERTAKSGSQPLKIRIASKALMLDTPIRRDQGNSHKSELRVLPQSQIRPITLTREYVGEAASKTIVR